MAQVHFRLAAFTDAAGRLNMDAPRHGNEDNMYVNAMLGNPVEEAFFQLDKDTPTTEFGCILVVADGMGGMNAGEVASEIAVQTVREAFAPEQMKESFTNDPSAREKYLKCVVEDADTAIKKHASEHPECDGMGSTITLLWLCGEEVTIAWCGDSRIYLFREPDGLRQISKDHSYVQELVDDGKITEEDAFNHPYNNVITRSLGDTSKKAVADSYTLPVFKGDIYLLNSDGLSGVLHDVEMDGIIRNNRQSMNACRIALWEAAEKAGWHDNVTAILCEIVEGPEYVQETPATTLPPAIKPNSFRMKWLWTIFALIALVAACLFLFCRKDKTQTMESSSSEISAVTDSVEVEEYSATQLPESDSVDIQEPFNSIDQ